MVTELCVPRGTQTIKLSDNNTVRGGLCRGRKGAGESPEEGPPLSKAGGVGRTLGRGGGVELGRVSQGK